MAKTIRIFLSSTFGDFQAERVFRFFRDIDGLNPAAARRKPSRLRRLFLN